MSQRLIKKGLSRPWFLFALVFAWKVALLLVSAQPVPANDSFFYDGAVVNYLLHGKYANPSIALVFPISGNEVFSAYPPLYQFSLLGWMSVFGTSALAAMTLHLVLFGLYMAVLLAIFRRLKAPVWCVHVTAGFLLLNTFHDRPDSLAHVLAMLALYCWVRSRPAAGAAQPEPQWIWAMAGFVVLTLCTSLQIGGVYFLLTWMCVAASSWFGGEKFPAPALTAMTLVPIGLVLAVKFAWPHLWAGFLEHALRTPSFTGGRVSQPVEVLKMLRTVPGVLLTALLLAWVFCTRRRNAWRLLDARLAVVTVAGLLGALAVVVAGLTVLTPNFVHVANYLQPLVVCGYLASSAAFFPERRWVRAQAGVLLALMALGSVRAVGMTTWGMACASDVGYRRAIQRVRQELAAPSSTAPRRVVVVSAAYLYEAARRQDTTWIHSDWLRLDRPRLRRDGTAASAPADELDDDTEKLIALKPDAMILTQMDYYRRYQTAIEQLKSRGDTVEIQLVNTAKIPAPDSIPSLQRVVQHIAWAPVIVHFSWK